MDYINMWMEWGEFVCLGSLKNFYENMSFFFFFCVCLGNPMDYINKCLLI